MSYETPDQPQIQPQTLTTPAKTSVLAILSLCLGIVSIPLIFVCIGLFTAIAGLVLGIIALVNIKSSNGSIKGKGLAIGGLTASVLAMIIYGGFVAYVGTMKPKGSEIESMIEQSIEEAEKSSEATPETQSALNKHR
jgi:Domain of unknown function (DUF4190)